MRLDPQRRLSTIDFEELKLSIYDTALRYNLSVSLNAAAPSRTEIADKLEKFVRDLSRLSTSLNELDDASIDWLFAITADKQGSWSWRIENLPPPKGDRRLAIDRVVADSLTGEAKKSNRGGREILIDLKNDLLGSLSIMAIGAISDLESSKSDPTNRKTGSIVDMTMDTPKRLLVEGCLGMYASFFPSEDPPTGTWSDRQPAVFLIMSTFEYATNTSAEDQGVGLESVYQSVLPVFRANTHEYSDFRRHRRINRLMSRVYENVTPSGNTLDEKALAAKADLQSAVDEGAITPREISDWLDMHLPQAKSLLKAR